MNELTQRTITAIALVTLIFGLIFKAPSDWFFLFLVAVMGIGFKEFAKLTKLKPTYQFFTTIFVVIFLIFISFYNFNLLYNNLFFTPILIILFLSVGIFWLKNLFLVFNYPNKIPRNYYAFHIINSILWLMPLLTLNILNQTNKPLLILLILIVAVADSFAYFSGRLFGKHKLAPSLSGSKTIEGVYGGLIGVLIITSAWMYYYNKISWGLLLLALVTGIFSVVGDLYESIYKREAGVKDSGNILPGHGGILDRIDGLLAAAPIFTIGVQFL